MVANPVRGLRIKCQSRLWSQRGTKVNGSHRGDNSLLRPTTGIQITATSYATLQAVAPTNNVKTVNQTSLLHIESNLDLLGLLSPTHDQRSQQQSGRITLQPVLINKSEFLKATHCTKIRKIEIHTEVHGGGGLKLVKPAREPESSRPKPCASLKKPHESCLFAAPCGPRSKKNDHGQTSAFPSETSRFKPVILAHR